MKKVILITGASSGIGKETAKLFADRGWNVIASMRSPEKENELNDIPNILITKLDVTDQESIKEAIKAGIERFGHIDTLVNNAGYGEFGIFECTDVENVKQQFEVNLFGVMDTIRAILPHFRHRKAGTILNVSSGAGKFTLPMISLYAASKFALEGFSEALYFELGSMNIKVKIVEPGGTNTNFSAVSNKAMSSAKKIDDYNPFIAAAGKMFQAMRENDQVSGQDVAKVIFNAVTDDSDTLRYSIGNEDFNARLESRYRMEDQAYVDQIKNDYLKFFYR